MKAVYYHGEGRFTVEACTPVHPGEGEVRLRVAYCGICGTDLHIAHGAMDQRIQVPQVIGHEMAGVVEAIGARVDGFAEGDPVVVRPIDSRAETAADRGVSHIARGMKFLGIDTPGAFQASWTVPAFTLHRLPPGADMRLAALVEPLAVAVHDVRRGEVKAGDTVVVIGGGPIGLLVGTVARHVGANVILSEISPARRSLASALGLDAIDPMTEDLLDLVESRTGGSGADVVFEVSGSAAGAETMTQVAGLRCRVVVVAIFGEAPKVRLFDLFWKELTISGARVYEPQDYDRAIELLGDPGLGLEKLVTAVAPLERLPELLTTLGGPGSDDVKVLIDCQA